MTQKTDTPYQKQILGFWQLFREYRAKGESGKAAYARCKLELGYAPPFQRQEVKLYLPDKKRCEECGAFHDPTVLPCSRFLKVDYIRQKKFRG